MKRISLIVAASVIALIAASTFAQTAEVGKIDALVKTIDARLKKKKSPELVFADTSDYETDAPEKWEKFASEDALDKHRESTGETYSIAYCWRDRGNLAKSNFTLFSPSGDWAKYVFHYFRTDGTLAKAAIDYRTFNEDMILMQDVYFDARGKVIKTTYKVLDLRTHKPKKITKDIRMATGEMRKETDYYKSVSKLPFAKLLK